MDLERSICLHLHTEKEIYLRSYFSQGKIALLLPSVLVFFCFKVVTVTVVSATA